MVLVAPVGYPVRYSIKKFPGFVIDNYFGTLEGNLVVVSLDKLSGLVVGTVEGYLVILLLVLLLGFPFYSPNTGADLPGMLLGYNLDLWFGSEVVRCLCYCLRLMDSHKNN